MRRAQILLLACLFPAVPALAGPASPTPEQKLDEARRVAVTAFLARQSVEAVVKADELTAVGADERAGWDGVKHLEAVRDFLKGAADASEVQKGKQDGETDRAYERRLLDACSGLKMNGQQFAKARGVYLQPAGAPGARPGTAPKTPQELAAEQAAVERMLANPSLPAGRREALSQRMAAIRRQLEAGPADGQVMLASAGGWGAGSGPMSREELRRLNAVPAASGPRSLRTGAIPAPAPGLREQLRDVSARHARLLATQQKKEGAVLSEFEEEYKRDPGTVGQAVQFWDECAARNSRSGSTAASWGCGAMSGLLRFSGLAGVEKNAAKLGYTIDNRDVSRGTKLKTGGALALDSGMTVLTFLPVAGGVSRLAQGEKVISFGPRAGSAIAGFTAVSDDAARAVSGEITTAIRTATKAGGTKPEQARAVLAGLRETGKKYGIQVAEDRSLLGMGMSSGGPASLVTNTRVGAAHEVTHAVQQLQLRAGLVRDFMARNGIAGRALNPAEMKEALRGVEAFERAIPAFEQGAAIAARSQSYTAGLLTNVSAFEKGLMTGRVPAFAPAEVGLMTNLYSRANYVLGFTQTQGFVNTGAMVIGVNRAAQ
ncbi:MAG: hypothetical protein HY928_09480 [Elusimicrobia bacterium]|nr:hypothetical protein [Elusimicrobiota bacterium]